MKRLTLLTAILLLVTANIFAQSTSKTIIIKENDDSNEKITIVERIFSSKLHQTLPDWYYGALNMNCSTFGPEAQIPLRSSSFEWGTYNQKTIFCTADNHFGMSWGLGISNSYNFFAHDMVLREDNDGKACFQTLNAYSSEHGNGLVTNYAHRSFLRYWSLRLPVQLHFQCSVNNTPVALAAGIEAEWRFGVRSFARYGGSKHTITKSLDYSPVGFNAVFSASGGNFDIFMRFGLTDFLMVRDMTGDMTDLYQMMIGFGFNFD